MATATITRLSPTMPSKGSYDYLYQANVGLQNLNSVWAHGPRRAGKENGPTPKRAKTTPSSLYDNSSPYATELLAIRLEYRLACALGKRTIQLRDRSGQSAPTPTSADVDVPLPRKAEPPLEDWTSDYVFDDETNPFALAEDDTKSTTPLRIAADKSNRQEELNATDIFSIATPQSSSAAGVHPTGCDSVSEVKEEVGPLTIHAPRAIRATRQVRPEIPGRAWRAPGPSPLSLSFNSQSYVEEAGETPSRDNEDDAPILRALGRRRHAPRPAIHPISRGLGSGRLSTPMRRELHRSQFLSSVCFLDIEAPELDLADERSIEWLLDTQADLLRGQRTIPGLAQFGLADPPKLGTSHRCLKWVQGSNFPRRVKDYGRAAEDMLARRRAREAAMTAE